ncbi:MAG: hypothetical protein ACTHK4_15885 [Mycobacteriales bacterium]
MLHASLTPFGVVRGTSRELVEAAAAVLAEPAETLEPPVAEALELIAA